MNNDVTSKENLDRRDFLRRGSLATMMAMMGGIELRADESAKSSSSTADGLTKIPVGPPVNYGVIGLGPWGREVVTTLGMLPDPAEAERNAPVVAICDKYPAALKRTSQLAPK